MTLPPPPFELRHFCGNNVLCLAFHLREKFTLTFLCLACLLLEALNGTIAQVDEEQAAFWMAAIQAIDGKPERGRRVRGLTLLGESALRVARFKVLPGQGVVGREID